MAKVNFIKHAMNLLSDEMQSDQGPGSYYDSWKANLAMLIHDGFNAEPFNIGTDHDPEWIGKPLDPSSVEDCNEIAERFLRLLFSVKK